MGKIILKYDFTLLFKTYIMIQYDNLRGEI